MERNRAREVDWPENDHAVPQDFPAGFGEGAVPALLGSKIDDDRAWPHAPDHLLGDEDRGELTGDERCRDDNVRRRHVLRHQLLLLPVELLRLGLGVTTLVLSVLRLEGELREPRTEALHLLLHGGTRIVRLYDGAKPFCRADCL